jgi:hypothetical protein
VSRNGFYVVICLLCVALLAVGYQLYQERHKHGIQIDLGGGKLTVETK